MSAQPFAGNRVANAKTLLVSTRFMPLVTAVFFGVAIVLGLLPNARPAVPTGDVPFQEFSSARARVHIDRIAKAPRTMGTLEHDRARDYIVSELVRLGLKPNIQRTTAISINRRGWAFGGNVANVIARLPGSGTGHAVLLSAHYDTVTESPGAADDGTGVAVLLETARALSHRAAPSNDLIFLFTDGEEYGLIGAEAFVSQYKPADLITAALNFEARGSGGPAYLFETSAQNSQLIRTFARSTKYPEASSLFYEVYRKLPNDTDLTVFKRAGFPAMNFAFIDRVVNYHTPDDTERNLDEQSLQQTGLYALQLAQAFGNSMAVPKAGGDLIYFTVARSGLLMYAAWWAVPLSTAAALMTIAAVGFALWRKRVTVTAVLAGVLAVPAVAILSAGCAGVVAFAISEMRPDYDSFVMGDVYHHWPFLGAELVAGLAATLMTLALFLRRWPFFGVWLGALLWALMADLAVALLMPGASYLLAWPHLITAACALLASVSRWFWQPQTERGIERLSNRGMIALAAGALLWTVFLASLFRLLPLALGLSACVPLALLLGFMACWQIPSFRWVSGMRARWVPIVAVFGVVMLIAIGFRQNRFDSHQPLQAAIFYGLMADEGSAVWGSPDPPSANRWIQAHFRPRARRGPLPEFTLSGGTFTSAPAPVLPIAPPEAELQSSTASAVGRTRWAIHLHSHRGAPNLVLRFPQQKNSFRLVSLNGHEALGAVGSDLRGIILKAVPAQGDDVVIDGSADSRPEFQLMDWTAGLPEALGQELARPPANIIPGAQFDLYNWSTVVAKQIRFGMPR
jgi:hypothetical protein